MKKVLNIWLRKNQLTKGHNDYSAEVHTKGHLDAGNIIDELINDGLNINREMALNLITQFTKNKALGRKSMWDFLRGKFPFSCLTNS